MAQKHEKKQVDADIPFSFLEELGHNTRAMERFFDLPAHARETLTDAVASAPAPDERGEQALKSLANGGEGYCDKF